MITIAFVKSSFYELPRRPIIAAAFKIVRGTVLLTNDKERTGGQVTGLNPGII